MLALRLLLVCAGAFFLGTAAEAGRELTGAEIRTLVSGKTAQFTGPYSGTITLKEDGSASLQFASGPRFSGKWWVEDDKFCRQWFGLNRRCVTLSRSGPDKVESDTGFVFSFN